MNTRKELGRIRKCEFGMGGYQNAMIGISFSLGGESWSVGDFWGNWSGERSKSAQWSEDDRLRQLGEVVIKIDRLLSEAKVKQVSDLEGQPVEVTFEGMRMHSWRILKEVL